MTLSNTNTIDNQTSEGLAPLRLNATAYQKILMPDGTVTGGRFDRSITADVIFPKDMSGETYLDIGCMEGFFPFEALKRGAKHVIGLDMNPNYVHNANVLAQKQNLPAEFHRLDIDNECPEGQYDYVSCLNVLHHLINPLEVIDKLISVTRKRLILEMAGFGPHERKKLGMSWLAGWVANRQPFVFVRQDGLINNRQKFFFSAPAMKNLLIGHRYVFADVEIIPSPFKGRYIAIGHKRRFKRLILLAGPTGAGKTTVAKKLANGLAPEIAGQLNMGDSSQWDYKEVNDFAKTTQAEFDNVVVSLDILERLKWNVSDDRKLRFMDLIRCADEVQIVTLGVEPKQLLKQFESAPIGSYVRKHGTELNERTVKEIHEALKDPNQAMGLYQHWIDFVSSQSISHSIVSDATQPSLQTPDAWMADIAGR